MTSPLRDRPEKPAGGPAELVRRWNALADELHLPRAAKLTPARARHAAARIRDGLLDRWDDLAAAIRESPWHLGDNDRGWRATLDWLLRPEPWLRLVEARTAGPPPPARSDRQRQLDLQRAEGEREWARIAAEREAREHANDDNGHGHDEGKTI